MANEIATDVDLRVLLKKYMDRVGYSEGVYFIYDHLPQQHGEDPPFTRQELVLLHELMDEIARGE